MRKILNNYVREIIGFQSRNTDGFTDYYIIINYSHVRKQLFLNLTNKHGRSFFQSFNKEHMLYILQSIFDRGWMSERIYYQLYDAVVDSNVLWMNPLNMKIHLN